jgi:hypothetical protein
MSIFGRMAVGKFLVLIVDSICRPMVAAAPRRSGCTAWSAAPLPVDAGGRIADEKLGVAARA